MTKLILDEEMSPSKLILTEDGDEDLYSSEDEQEMARIEHLRGEAVNCTPEMRNSVPENIIRLMKVSSNTWASIFGEALKDENKDLKYKDKSLLEILFLWYTDDYQFKGDKVALYLMWDTFQQLGFNKNTNPFMSFIENGKVNLRETTFNTNNIKALRAAYTYDKQRMNKLFLASPSNSALQNPVYMPNFYTHYTSDSDMSEWLKLYLKYIFSSTVGGADLTTAKLGKLKTEVEKDPATPMGNIISVFYNKDEIKTGSNPVHLRLLGINDVNEIIGNNNEGENNVKTLNISGDKDLNVDEMTKVLKDVINSQEADTEEVYKVIVAALNKLKNELK